MRRTLRAALSGTAVDRRVPAAAAAPASHRLKEATDPRIALPRARPWGRLYSHHCHTRAARTLQHLFEADRRFPSPATPADREQARDVWNTRSAKHTTPPLPIATVSGAARRPRF